MLLISDPGLPTRRARSIRDDLQRLLEETFGGSVRLHVHTEMLRVRGDDSLDLSDAVDLGKEYDGHGATLFLTEIPRLNDGHPLIAEIFPAESIAVVSCPTLGAFASRKRILDTLMACMVRFRSDDPVAESEASRFGRPWAKWTHANSSEEHVVLESARATGGVRTVLGMVAGNQPFKTAPRLSSALAAASAAGAFGIFFTSIWQMSASLSVPRLLAIGGLAVILMTTWLLASNRLWDSPKRDHFARIVLLYNLSTVTTLLLCVLTLYAVLVLLILGAGLIVIAPEFMEQILGEPPTFWSYLGLAWLSAAMGVVAGALGSSFDSRTDMRSITHGQRERQRQYTEDEA
ncbi:MAG: hypothetical protein ACTHZX_09150 [Microbacterium sp.]